MRSKKSCQVSGAVAEPNAPELSMEIGRSSTAPGSAAEDTKVWQRTASVIGGEGEGGIRAE